jgi:hypothetical protein
VPATIAVVALPLGEQQPQAAPAKILAVDAGTDAEDAPSGFSWLTNSSSGGPSCSCSVRTTWAMGSPKVASPMRPRSVRTNGRGGCLAVLLGGGWALGGAADGTPGAAGLTTPRWVKAGSRVPATAATTSSAATTPTAATRRVRRVRPRRRVASRSTPWTWGTRVSRRSERRRCSSSSDVVTVGLLPVGELSGKALAGARQAGLDRADGQGQVAGDLLDRQVGQVVQGQHLPVAQ